jgi:hypothetical protein
MDNVRNGETYIPIFCLGQLFQYVVSWEKLGYRACVPWCVHIRFWMMCTGFEVHSAEGYNTSSLNDFSLLSTSPVASDV